VSARTERRPRNANRVRRAEHEREPPGPQTLFDEVIQAVFDDGDLAATERGDLVRIDVCAHDVVAEMGEARPRREADVPRPDDRDARHGGSR